MTNRLSVFDSHTRCTQTGLLLRKISSFDHSEAAVEVLDLAPHSKLKL
ncbi:hypothetical protein [Vibrio maritimus]|nr:hypothetical protein [Vibrio maritimus]